MKGQVRLTAPLPLTLSLALPLLQVLISALLHPCQVALASPTGLLLPSLSRQVLSPTGPPLLPPLISSFPLRMASKYLHPLLIFCYSLYRVSSLCSRFLITFLFVQLVRVRNNHV